MRNNIESKNLAVLLLIGVLLFAVGIGIGIIYQSQRSSPMTSAVKSLSSDIIASIAAYGQVSKIDDRNITLSFSEDNLTIFVSPEAQVYSFKKQATGSNSTQNLANFNDIKKGDFINISLKFYSDGRLEGNNVVILPPISVPVE